MTRIFGWTDEVTSCDCCGKVDLSGTFAVELETGGMVHYGSVCVKRNTGIKNPTKAADDYARERKAAARAEIERTDEYRTYRTILDAANYRVDRGQEQLGDSRAIISGASAALREVSARIIKAHRA